MPPAQISAHRLRVMEAEYAARHQAITEEFERHRAELRASIAQHFNRGEGPYHGDSSAVKAQLKILARKEQAQRDTLEEHRAKEMKVCQSRKYPNMTALMSSGQPRRA